MGYLRVVMQSYVRVGIFKSPKKFMNLRKRGKIRHFLRALEKGKSCMDYAEDAGHVRGQRRRSERVAQLGRCRINW